MGNRITGYVMIGAALIVAAVVYSFRNPSSGPSVPNAGSGFGDNPAGGSGPGSSCGSTICLGQSLDGDSDGVSLQPQSQTEGAYNTDATDSGDAFGPDENNQGSELISN
jgi:hypothetical protein